MTNTTIVQTNPLYAIRVTDAFYEVCVETNIPRITNSISIYDTVGIDTYSDFQSYTNQTKSWTSEYYEAMNPCDYRILSFSTSITHSITCVVITANATNHVTISIARSATGCVERFIMNADDIRAYEGYLAVSERINDTEKTNFYESTTYFYKGNYGELFSGLKKKTIELIPLFVDIVTTVTNNLGHHYGWSNYYDTSYFDPYYAETNFYASELKNYGQYYSNNIFNVSIIPSNYFYAGSHNDFPGSRGYQISEKHGELGPSYGLTVTSTARIIKYTNLSEMADNALITNQIVLYNRSVTNIVGTNNQEVSAVLINTNAPAFIDQKTEIDYGWKNFTNVFRYLVVKCVSSALGYGIYDGETEKRIMSRCYTNEPDWYDCGSAFHNSSLDTCYQYVSTNFSDRFIYSVSLGYEFRDIENVTQFDSVCGTNYEWYIAKEIIFCKSRIKPIVEIPYTSSIPIVTKYNNRAIIEYVGTNYLAFNSACGIPMTTNNFSRVSAGTINIDFSSAYTNNNKIYALGTSYEEYFWNVEIDEDYCNSAQMDNYADDFGDECFAGGVYGYLSFYCGTGLPISQHGELGPPYIWVLDYRNSTNGFKYY
jgi:hypothetical protein